MKLVERTLTVELDPGLQARPAARFVQEAAKYASNVFLEKNDTKINAKSIMGLMSLAIAQGETIKLIIEGPDEEEAMTRLADFIQMVNV